MTAKMGMEEVIRRLQNIHAQRGQARRRVGPDLPLGLGRRSQPGFFVRAAAQRQDHASARLVCKQLQGMQILADGRLPRLDEHHETFMASGPVQAGAFLKGLPDILRVQGKE